MWLVPLKKSILRYLFSISSFTLAQNLKDMIATPSWSHLKSVERILFNMSFGQTLQDWDC